MGLKYPLLPLCWQWESEHEQLTAHLFFILIGLEHHLDHLIFLLVLHLDKIFYYLILLVEVLILLYYSLPFNMVFN